MQNPDNLFLLVIYQAEFQFGKNDSVKKEEWISWKEMRVTAKHLREKNKWQQHHK